MQYFLFVLHDMFSSLLIKEILLHFPLNGDFYFIVQQHKDKNDFFLDKIDVMADLLLEIKVNHFC